MPIPAIPFFAVEIEAGEDKALLMRVAQRLSWVGIEPERFFLKLTGSGQSVRMEFLFGALPERADILVAQLRKLIAVSRVELRPALIARQPPGAGCRKPDSHSDSSLDQASHSRMHSND